LRVVDFGTAVFLDRSRPISIASPPSSAAVNDIVDDEDDSAAVDITAAARGTPAFTPPESLQTQRRLPQPTGSAINSYSSGSSDRVNIPSSLATIDWVKVDIWAMGVTLYCMLYGVLPFTGENILELNDRIRTAR
jgi:[calcium/calmodulin-dependent protein kinase] kinase